jgi:hypothetical protein
MEKRNASLFAPGRVVKNEYKKVGMDMLSIDTVYAVLASTDKVRLYCYRTFLKEGVSTK